MRLERFEETEALTVHTKRRELGDDARLLLLLLPGLGRLFIIRRVGRRRVIFLLRAHVVGMQRVVAVLDLDQDLLHGILQGDVGGIFDGARDESVAKDALHDVDHDELVLARGMVLERDDDGEGRLVDCVASSAATNKNLRKKGDPTVVCLNDGLADLVERQSLSKGKAVGDLDGTVWVLIIVPSIDFNASDAVAENVAVSLDGG